LSFAAANRPRQLHIRGKESCGAYADIVSASRLDDVIPIGKPAADIILSRSRRGRLTQKQPGPLKNSIAANIAKLPEFLPIHVDR
jgi:hypothetical protein